MSSPDHHSINVGYDIVAIISIIQNHPPESGGLDSHHLTSQRLDTIILDQLAGPQPSAVDYNVVGG